MNSKPPGGFVPSSGRQKFVGSAVLGNSLFLTLFQYIHAYSISFSLDFLEREASSVGLQIEHSLEHLSIPRVDRVSQVSFQLIKQPLFLAAVPFFLSASPVFRMRPRVPRGGPGRR